MGVDGAVNLSVKPEDGRRYLRAAAIPMQDTYSHGSDVDASKERGCHWFDDAVVQILLARSLIKDSIIREILLQHPLTRASSNATSHLLLHPRTDAVDLREQRQGLKLLLFPLLLIQSAVR